MDARDQNKAVVRRFYAELDAILQSGKVLRPRILRVKNVRRLAWRLQRSVGGVDAAVEAGECRVKRICS